jgi:hypothetical protein
VSARRVAAIDSNGRTIWIDEAHRVAGKRFVVRAEGKLTAFVELESPILRAHLLSGLPLQNFRAEFAVADASADFHLWPNYCNCPYDLAAIVHGDAVTAAQRRVGS